MKRLRRVTLILVIGLIAIGAATSVGVVMPRTVRIVGPDGTPVEAWAAYHYDGYRFGLVETLTYTRAGAIARPDPDGNLHLPGRIYLRLPIDGWLGHRIDLLYAPNLHAAISYPLAADPSSRSFSRSDDGGTISLADRTDDPEMWMRDFDTLFAFVRYDLLGGWQRKIAAGPQEVDHIARQVIDDYRAFLEHHAATPRATPTIGMEYLQYLPEAEREVTLARVREGLAREPLWGPHVERTWDKRIAELERKTGG